MLYAAAAVELEDRVETHGNLLAALQRNPAAIRVLRLSDRSAQSLAVSPDGRLLASGDQSGVVRFTDLRTWQQRGAVVQLPRAVAQQAMAFSPDGRHALTGSGGTLPGPDGAINLTKDNPVHVWDVESGKEVRRLDGHQSYVRGVAYSADGRFAVSCGNDGTIRVWGAGK